MKMKKLFKKVGALALAAALTMGMSTTAFAYVGTDDANTMGSITVHKYASMTVTGDHGDGTQIADTSKFGEPLANATFTLKKVDLPAEVTSGTKELDGEYRFNGGSYTAGDAVTSVEFKEKGADTWLSGQIGADTIDGTNGGVTNTNGEVVFGKGTSGSDASSLEQGYYLLEETVTPAGYEKGAASLISIPLTNATGDGHLYDIHVYPKNVTNDKITKTLDDGTQIQSPDTEFTWTIKAALADDAGHTVADLKGDSGYGSMVVEDTLPAGMKITGSEVYYTTDDTGKLESGTDYTYVEASESNGNTASWTLTDTGKDKVIAANATALRIVVTTEFSSFSSNTGTNVTGLTNTAKYTFTPAGGDPYEEETEEKTPLANIGIRKVLSEKAEAEQKSAAGIIFLLATKADVDISKVDDGSATSADGFVVGADGKPLQAVTNDDGYAYFEGLTYNSASDTKYYLIEYKTNDGLQLKNDAMEVTLKAGQTGTYTEIAEVTNYLTTETDPDNPTFELPLTGGIGSVIFIVVGAVIVLGGVALVLRSRKKQ